MRNIVLAAALLLGAHSAGPVDMNAYGLWIGKPLTLPECPTYTIGDRKSYAIVEDRVPCWEAVSTGRTGGVRTIESPYVILRFPAAERPQHASGNSVRVVVADGILQLVVLWTSGALVQERVLADLKHKYGSPTETRVIDRLETYEKKTEIIEAYWDLSPNLIVNFFGVDAPQEGGHVVVGTPAGFDKLLRRTLESLPRRHPDTP